VTGRVGIENYVLAAGTNNLATAATGQTINANATTDGQVLTLTGSHAVTVNLVLGDLTSTSSGDITVVATTGSNVIATGAGADTITGGAGVDTIALGAGDTSVDNVIMSTVTTSADRDTITNFTVGGGTDDTITLGLANTTATTGAGAADLVASTTAAGTGGGALAIATASSSADDVVHFTNVTAAGVNSGDLSSATDGTELLKALTDASAADTYTGITATTAADTVYFTATQGGVTYIYHADAGSGDNLFAAAEIQLIGTADAALDAGSFLIA
jgi:hypothetical protein